ncbi:hypothetical protein Acr_29g0004880 [Actinidia rufa]|uniref:Retrovirus-related Pol polyprotein from transposon TNT 1-94-like beta-barrel domain-containing protein n=1 Tax=Actinidia rufa TaxID=165716 RepID=A0A7J0HDZ3_9ERIC|nr:hypothetical protein Acr_29g0004880 [Actinidia rufa]
MIRYSGRSPPPPSLGCSSRRYGAPALNRVGNGVRTRPHEPFEDRRVRSVSATRPGRSHAQPRARGRTHAPTSAKERLPRACTRRETAARAATRSHAPRRETHALHAPEEELPRATRHTRARDREEGHIKRDCPKYKAQDHSSDTAATAVMADDDEIDVLLAASDDGKSDWVLDSGSAYHLCRDREVFSTYAACEGRIWMANNTASRVVGREGQSGSAWQTGDAKGCRFDASGGILRVSKENKEMLWGKKTGGLYRLEENVQTGGATVRHGSSGISEENGQGKQPLHRGTQSKRRGTWRIQSGTRAQGDALEYVRKSGQTRVMQPVQDVHREAQRNETKSILRSFVRTREERWSHDNSQSDVLCGAPRWGVWCAPVGGAGHLGEKVQALRCGGAYTSVGSGVAR